MANVYVICHVILCHDMTICHDMRFISEVLIYHCMRRVISARVPMQLMTVFPSTFHREAGGLGRRLE